MNKKKTKQWFFIDLDVPDHALNVTEYEKSFLAEELKEWGAKRITELSDYDWRIFASKQKADQFLSRYQKVKATLSNRKICLSRNLPAILYKRRYIVQTLMGLKNQTYRSYKKEWMRGQLFNLHDQTFFLTVKLTSLSYCREKRSYCYKFTLPK